VHGFHLGLGVDARNRPGHENGNGFLLQQLLGKIKKMGKITTRRFKIKVVVMDSESFAAKAALETNEVEFAPLPAGVHDPIVESRLRRLNYSASKGVRSIIPLPDRCSPG
jgi:hypothetical protein